MTVIEFPAKASAARRDSLLECEEIIAAIHALIRGKGVEAQSIVLSDLVTTFIVGFHPAVRAEMLEFFVDQVKTLIPFNEREVFGEARHPGWKDMQ